ncbi:acyltransferase family protein, partial [Hymenobacter lapidarius]|uniref:acyltransferase family protein n=1 Tax=Hymenobacter lapidarius TaxID=1908237 RepID=UPI0011131FF3
MKSHHYSFVSNDLSKQKAIYYPSLTGIRAIAAYMVVLFHIAQDFQKEESHEIISTIVLKFFLEWHIGVTIFFVLSGFLITIRYAGRIEPSLGWAKKYMKNRFARIYPIYFLLTVTTFIETVQEVVRARQKGKDSHKSGKFEVRPISFPSLV